MDPICWVSNGCGFARVKFRLGGDFPRLSRGMVCSLTKDCEAMPLAPRPLNQDKGPQTT